MNAPERVPWHEGERALQNLAGVSERMAELGPRVLRDHMPEQHRLFFAQLPFLAAGSIDDRHQPWAGVLAAPPGFVHSPDPQHLRVDARPLAGDPLAAALVTGASIGLLGIEPHTRRRNRMNGVIDVVDAEGFSVEVRQSFGNCPRYIQAREAVFVPRDAAPKVVQLGGRLDANARRMVTHADTFFIATAYPSAAGSGVDGEPSHGVDVSHRGGRPGFVGLSGEGTLTVPDFDGNLFFNTLGNIVVHPRAGLLFIDFETGDLLQVAVSAEVIWNGPEVDAFEGARRLLRMQVLAARRMPAALPLRWGRAQMSPHLEATGRWAQAA
ncbi:pyridoxamine 5'-phosphate oxidase, FMN-binding family [Variovorax sp. SRS16]|uniref:pyridoxamine 5'-phosphate oxidase family protein n=1 Tax=Variovorax sp. SRS16 TaxID=282217 RepID=UPI0013181018|nr:pyridoxamine 5'-phosphate oxidase family protein [Variovorax sp. SRS16]VTU13631.1 pyridoxamine 5'-phosphate oxidase, FMN-binding family [Variovorax sp. SRS16]